MKSKPLRVALGTLICFFFASHARGQDTSDRLATKNPNGDLFLASFIKSYTPTSNRNWNVTLQLTIRDQSGVSSSEVIKIVDPHNVKREIVGNSVTTTSVFTNGGGRQSNNGKQEVIPVWSVLAAKLSEFPFPAIVEQYSQPDTLVQLVEETDASSEGLLHYKLTKVYPKTESIPRRDFDKIYERDLYFDPKLGQLVRQRYWIFSPSTISNNAPVDVFYSDYRESENVKLPFHIVKRLGAVTISDAIVQQIDLHASNSTDTF